MARLSRIGRAWLEDHLTGRGLTLADYAVIEAVAHRATSQREIATAAGYDPSDIVATLDRLQDRGMISREPDPNDRRRHVVTLTRRGQATLRTCRTYADEARQRLLAPLTAREAEQFEKALARLLQAHNP